MPKRTLTTLTKRQIDAAPPDSCIWDVQVPGFGVRTMKSGLRSFVFQFRSRTGAQGKITIGRYPAMAVDEARRIARSHKSQVDTGGNPSRERQNERQAMTLAELATYYAEDYAVARGLTPRSVKEAKRLLERFVLPVIGRRKVAEIDTIDVRRIHGAACRNAGRYQANRLRAVLSKMFNLAIQMKCRADNPCCSVEKFHEDQRHRALSKDEVARLLAACDDYEDQNAANAVRLLLFTGARLREVLKASWSQFDLDRAVWVKPSHHTKTKKEHEVQIAGTVAAMLRLMRSVGANSDLLFPGRDLTRPRSDLKRPWATISSSANLRGIRLHDLRRTYATFMLSSGANISVVGKALGHTQASTTQRYADLLKEVQKKAADRTMEEMGVLRVVA